MSSDYKEKFKALPDLKLLDIINNSDAYHPEAVEAAQKELNSRNLTTEEIDEINADLESATIKDYFQKPAIKTIQKDFNDQVRDAIKTLSPIGSKSTRDTIQIIGALFVLNALFMLQKLFRRFEMLDIDLYFMHNLFTFSFSLILFITCLFVGINLWKFNKIGWKVGIVLLFYLLATFLSSLVFAIHWKLTTPKFYDSFSINFVNEPAILPSLFYVFLTSLPIWYFYQKRVRIIFGIQLDEAKTWIGFSMIGCVLLLAINLFFVLF